MTGRRSHQAVPRRQLEAIPLFFESLSCSKSLFCRKSGRKTGLQFFWICSGRSAKVSGPWSWLPVNPNRHSPEALTILRPVPHRAPALRFFGAPHRHAGVRQEPRGCIERGIGGLTVVRGHCELDRAGAGHHKGLKTGRTAVLVPAQVEIQFFDFVKGDGPAPSPDRSPFKKDGTPLNIRESVQGSRFPTQAAGALVTRVIFPLPRDSIIEGRD